MFYLCLSHQNNVTITAGEQMKNSIKLTTLGVGLLSFSVMAADNVTTLDKFFSKDGIKVTAENYPTLETSRQLLKNQSLVGVNKLLHKRELTPTDEQPVVRMNRDTYYSMATVDVSKGATITLPEIPAGKYMSMEVITEDHRIQKMQYGPGRYQLTTHIGEHVYIIVRLDSTLSKQQVREIQDKMQLTANASNQFTSKQVDKHSFEQVENKLKAKMPVLMKEQGAEATYGMFTDPNDESNKLFDKEKYAVGAAVGWGGAQLADNVYEVSGNYPIDVCHQVTFEDPKNKAFWSITVYNKKGFMFNDRANLSSETAKANKDGSYTVSFGCGPEAINNIETENDTGMFNLAVRHYIPSERVKVDGYRVLPLLKAVK